MEESGMLAIMGHIGPHWPSLMREFICNLSEDITDPSSPMFQKVKLRGFVFDFSPLLINRHYGRQNEGITGSTLKLADIIKTLIGDALSEWPTKGQLQALTLSLRYVVLHKASIVNLVPTTNNMNFSEAMGRMMTWAKLKPIGFSSLICSILIHQHPEVLKAEDGPGEDVKPLTITDKLMTRKHVVDVQIKELSNLGL
ncbi:hypothetical protein LIER_37332 [Lithospermum erythrorhizon]|uniref:Uncharacterized protein n=1 Tax=Lithospermum erythrorhizon TaxID=34254 RepID=A0AAV3PJ44_LITER